MFATLIDNVIVLAKSLLEIPLLPEDTEKLKQHAIDFSENLAPELKSFSTQVTTFAAQTSIDADQLQT